RRGSERVSALRAIELGQTVEPDAPDPFLLRPLAVAAAIGVVDLLLSLLAQQSGEPGAKRVASAREPALGHELVEGSHVLICHTYRDLNCHTLKYTLGGAFHSGPARRIIIRMETAER